MGELFGLSGSTAVVTGSSRGIGLAIARVLLGQGASVVVNGYAADETAAAEAGLAATFPGRVVALAGDVGEAEVGQRLVEVAVLDRAPA
ncbi:SDR family NAD(P)-dependent oxidoreductase [Kribbella sp.]|uniref:SDR family NAD(P)-dependent oxidoreductase n=1 Tax=Kribbella sp. TaxID=1871183 RepID=UPI002D399533|nr:SDR family NAD(P)-dependent oxidoreductase [Kribbella sp.]HZX02038.1 SDR family NAD(P)-dependent oxidoreductase [Kribbella sp.]